DAQAESASQCALSKHGAQIPSTQPPSAQSLALLHSAGAHLLLAHPSPAAQSARVSQRRSHPPMPSTKTSRPSPNRRFIASPRRKRRAPRSAARAGRRVWAPTQQPRGEPAHSSRGGAHALGDRRDGLIPELVEAHAEQRRGLAPTSDGLVHAVKR